MIDLRMYLDNLIKKKITFTFILISLLVVANLNAKNLNKTLHILNPMKIKYSCNSNVLFEVDYYILSDYSLSFVRFHYKNRIETLPRIVSASGSRFSDLHEYEWWSKGNKGILFSTNENNNQLLECVEKKF